MFNLWSCNLLCPLLANCKISFWAKTCILGQINLCAKSTLADQAWLCLHVFTAHPALHKWFCILTKCTVTFLYLLGAPPPPTQPREINTVTRLGSCQEVAMATVLLSAATFLVWRGLEGRGKKMRELGGFLIRVQIKRVTVICGHRIK